MAEPTKEELATYAVIGLAVVGVGVGLYLYWQSTQPNPLTGLPQVPAPIIVIPSAAPGVVTVGAPAVLPGQVALTPATAGFVAITGAAPGGTVTPTPTTTTATYSLGINVYTATPATPSLTWSYYAQVNGTPVYPLTLTWDFGDGTGATQTANGILPLQPIQHTYASKGYYLIRLTGRDAAGRIVSVTRTLNLTFV